MAKGLTQKQQDILDYILAYVEKEGYPPSIREIGKGFKIGSLRGVTVHLDALEKKQYISRTNLPRSIKVIHPDFIQTGPRVTTVPLVGTIAAGEPILAIEHVEDNIPVPNYMVNGVRDAFALRVKGESMSGEGILPDDIVVVRPQITARQNELVAVLIDDQATVKRINYTKDGMVLLMPSNPSYSPIEVNTDNSKIIGKIVGLIRDYTS